MIWHVLATAACIAVLLLSVIASASLVGRANLLESNAENWIAGISLFVVALNMLFALLSLLPIERPIRVLALPLHALLLGAAFWHLRRQPAVGGPRIGLLERMRGLGWQQAGLMLLIAATLAAWAVQGLLSYPSGIDELSYHGPQAFGIYQQGRIRDFAAWPAWIHYYPQGGAVLWAWTMLFTGRDVLFHSSQFLFLAQLLLAVWVLAGKFGADTRSRWLGLVVVCAMPVLYLLATIIGADLGCSAAMLSFLAVLAPGAQPLTSGKAAARFGLALVMLAEAAFLKIPILPLIYFALAGAAFLWAAMRAGLLRDMLQQAFASRYALLVLLCLLGGFACYALNWYAKGNPFFPLTVRVAGIEVFKGTLWAIEDVMIVHSSFGDVRAMGWLQRWHAVFADWFAPLNTDALGSAGPAFLAVALALAASKMASRLAKPTAWTWAMLGILLSIFVIPGAYLPRYSLAWLCLVAALAATACSRISRALPGIVVVVVLAALPGLARQTVHMTSTLTWLSDMAAPKSVWEDRGRSIPQKMDLDRVLMPSARMLTVLREQVKPGQTLYYATKVYATTMWNLSFDNRIRYFPTVQLVDQLPVNVPPADGQWLSVVQADKPDWLLVYASSNVASQLSAASLATRYQVVASDAPTGNPSVDAWNAVLLQRVE